MKPRLMEPIRLLGIFPLGKRILPRWAPIGFVGLYVGESNHGFLKDRWCETDFSIRSRDWVNCRGYKDGHRASTNKEPLNLTGWVGGWGRVMVCTIFLTRGTGSFHTWEADFHCCWQCFRFLVFGSHRELGAAKP